MDKRVAVFGGTFNPIHNGHVEIVRSVLSLPSVSRVIVIPTALPPHKAAKSLASGEQRMAMCRLALSEFPTVEISDIELSRGGKSYTYDTLCELKKSVTDRIALVCGGDMITTFSGWYRYGDILKIADIIALRRVGIDNSEFDKSVEELRACGGNITVMDTKIDDISSSRVREGERSLIPDLVLEYININGLYEEE